MRLPPPLRGGEVGVILAGLLAAWALLAHPNAAGGAAFTAMLGCGALMWAVGGVIGRWRPAAPGIIAAAVVCGLFVVSLPDSLSGPAAPPLGYANANAALVTAAVAGLLGLVSMSNGLRELVLQAAGLGAAAFSLLVISSRAGALACVVLLILAPFLLMGSRRLWQVASIALLSSGLSFTIALALSQRNGVESQLIDSTLSSVRPSLWSDALDQAIVHPWRGVGPGNFSMHSPVASADPDLAWAHSAPLQILAELGFVGLALLFLLIAWLVWYLGRASIVLCALCLQPMMDYILHFWPVVAISAFVLGGYSALPAFSRSRSAGG